MTLATHGIVGAAAATLAPGHPVIAFALAFASHLAIDSLPHRDYELLSLVRGKTKIENDMVFGRAFLLDLLRTGTDAFIGLCLALLIFGWWMHVPVLLVLIGVVGGVLPDALQLVYFKLRPAFLTPLQRFHIWVQDGKERPQWPLWAGITLQAFLVFCIVIVRKLL